MVASKVGKTQPKLALPPRDLAARGQCTTLACSNSNTTPMMWHSEALTNATQELRAICGGVY